MTDEKQTNSQKSQGPSVENGQGLEPPEPNERGIPDQAMSDRGSEPHVANGVTDDLASEDVNPGASGISQVDKPQDPLLAMTAERDDLKDQLLRAMADTENMRRRNEREAANVRKYGHTPFARDLVGAIDNLSLIHI